MSIRDITTEGAAIAMGQAQLNAGSLSLRDRRELAAIAFDAAARAIADELRAEGNRLQGIAEQTNSVPGFAHALSFGDASRHVLTITQAGAPA